MGFHSLSLLENLGNVVTYINDYKMKEERI